MNKALILLRDTVALILVGSALTATACQPPAATRTWLTCSAAVVDGVGGDRCTFSGRCGDCNPSAPRPVLKTASCTDGVLSLGFEPPGSPAIPVLCSGSGGTDAGTDASAADAGDAANASDATDVSNPTDAAEAGDAAIAADAADAASAADAADAASTADATDARGDVADSGMSSPDTGIDSSVDTGTSSADASSTDSAAPDSPVTGVSHVLYLVATPSGALGGIAGADALCNAHLPPGATSARALLVDNSARIACTTPDCSGGPSEHVDWPLLPNTRYTRPDGTLIATTNANGVFTSLNNPISTTLVEVWTGVQSSWIPIPPRCSDGTGSWTSASNSSFGGAGRANAPDIVGAFQGLAQFCDRNNVSLYCVVP